MTNKYRIVKRNEGKARKEWPAVTYLGSFGGAFLGYAITRIGLNSFPHPYHWAGALLGAILGLGGGWIWFLRRGDIF